MAEQAGSIANLNYIELKKNKLIISKNKIFWDENFNNILLGYWCKTSTNYNNDIHYDLEIPTFYENFKFDNQIRLNKIILYENKLIPVLSSLLNKIHNEDHSVRYWEIIIGPWLRIFLEHYVSITENLKFILANYNIEIITIISQKDILIYPPNDYNEFQINICDSNWNDNFISSIIILNKFENIKVENIKVENINYQTNKLLNKNLNLKQKENFIDKFRKFVNKIVNIFPINNNGPFIITSFLPFFEDFILKLSHFQIPIQWETNFSTTNLSYEKNFRTDYVNIIAKNIDVDSEINLILKLFHYTLPLNYLEKYNSIKLLNKTQNWPNNPKFIFTSNSQYNNDIFKIWVAEKISKKIPYFIGQHGNNYGTHFNIRTYNSIEERTANKFITWGWGNLDNKYIVPGFVFKTTKIFKINSNYKGNKNFLFILDTIDDRIPLSHYLYDFTPEILNNYKKYFQILNSEILAKHTIRIRHNNTSNFGGEYEFLTNLHLNLNFEFGFIPFKRAIKKYDLIIFAYDSTGILELIVKNRPFVAFLNRNEYDILTEEALISYNIMINKKIFFINILEMAKHIEQINNNINEWWYSNEIQNTINNFSNTYAKRSTRPIRHLNNIFNDK